MDVKFGFLFEIRRVVTFETRPSKEYLVVCEDMFFPSFKVVKEEIALRTVWKIAGVGLEVF